MNILVLGGAGFLGSYVVDALLAAQHQVTIFDRQHSRWCSAKSSNPGQPENAVNHILGDLNDSEAVVNAVVGQDVVYNFAGLADVNEAIKRPVDCFNLNVMANLNVLEACRKAQVKRFIYASSAYVFSNKGGFYGASKKASELVIEQYAAQFGLQYTILRYGSVYGERADESNRIYRLVREALTQGKITFLGDGSEVREYIHGRDAASLSVQVLEDSFVNKNVLLTGIEKYEYRQLLDYLREMINDDITVDFLNQDYKGHYRLTPYSFSPSLGIKLVNNPSVDFGQGLLECVETVYNEAMHNEAMHNETVRI